MSTFSVQTLLAPVRSSNLFPRVPDFPEDSQAEIHDFVPSNSTLAEKLQLLSGNAFARAGLFVSGLMRVQGVTVHPLKQMLLFDKIRATTFVKCVALKFLSP